MWDKRACLDIVRSIRVQKRSINFFLVIFKQCDYSSVVLHYADGFHLLPFFRSSLLLFCAGAFFSPACLAAPPADHWRNLIAQQQQREQARQESSRKEQHLLLESPPLASSPMAQVPDSGRCFPIHRVVLRGEQAERFRFALRAARRETSFQAGECLDAKRIDRLLTSTQNALIARCSVP